MALIELIAGALSGGATGLIGTAVSHVVEFKRQNQQNTHELAMAEQGRLDMQMELQSRERIASTQADAAIQVADAELLTSSFAADQATYTQGPSRWDGWLVFVDLVRGLTRPGITAYGFGFLTLMWFTASADTAADLSIQNKIAAAVIYITTTASLWWFGTRNLKPGGR